MSFILATIINKRRSPMPIYSAMIRNFSPGLRPVIISYSKKRTCPPSNAGIGSMFMNARMMLKKAVMLQNIYQFHSGGNIEAIEPKPPILFAPSPEIGISYHYIARKHLHAVFCTCREAL